MTTNVIKKAVFPIAGLGTRFLPATKASPKEMLPVVDKPLIQYAVEEAYAAGIRQMIFVTGRTKRAIEDHYDDAPELIRTLEEKGKDKLLKLTQDIMPDDMQCVYVRQPRALGLGHAVYCAKELVGDQSFAVLLADDLMVGQPPIMAQMVDQYSKWKASMLAVQDVPKEHTDRYGIVDGAEINSVLTDVSSMVEKPKPEDAPTTLAVAGRYILTSGIFDELAQQKTGAGGEVQLTDAIASLLRREKVFAYRYEGERYDCGNKLGFLQATVALGKMHPIVGEDFGSWLKECGG